MPTPPVPNTTMHQTWLDVMADYHIDTTTLSLLEDSDDENKPGKHGGLCLGDQETLSAVVLKHHSAFYRTNFLTILSTLANSPVAVFVSRASFLLALYRH